MKLIKADLEAIRASATQIKRKNRTISLEDDQYEDFQKACYEDDLAANKVIDKLIKLYLDARTGK